MLILQTRVQPRARKPGLGEVFDQQLRLRLNAPPVDGRANEEARQLLARAFGVSLSRVTLLRGQHDRNKIFRIERPALLPSGLLAAPG